MTEAIAKFISLSFLSGACVFASVVLAWRVLPFSSYPPQVSALVRWSLQGLIFPVIFWGGINIGMSWSLHAFMPQVQLAQAKGVAWFPAWLSVTGAGIFVVSTYWAAVTLGWSVWLAGKGTSGEARSNFKGLCLTCCLGMLIPAAVIVLIGGWSLVGFAALAVLLPLAGYSPSLLKPVKTPPMYARAIARMKFGKYSEAEWEIIRELEKAEDDFDGWMMLAELYAVHFRDLSQAEQTILEICDHPKTSPSQISVALHRLADWHLKFSGNPAAARRALQIITERLCGTHLARMAQLRLAQLPRTAAEWKDQQQAPPIPLPALSEHAIETKRMERHEAAEAANQCVDRLNVDPNDVPAREKLARIFAEHLDRPELGLEQLTLLLNMPDQPEGKRAEWLSLSAAWHLHLRKDGDSARKFLLRVIHEFPQTPQAFGAKRQLQLLERGESPGAPSRA